MNMDGLAYLDENQISDLRLFADTTIARGDFLSGARLHELLCAYEESLEIEDLKGEIEVLVEALDEAATEAAEFRDALGRLETKFDEQLDVMRVALEPVPQPKGKSTKRNQQISRQSHLLEIEGAAKRMADQLSEISSEVTRLHESLIEHVRDLSALAEDKKNRK
jgi:hypothetical protein